MAATERESYLQAKLDRLYELTGHSPAMPLEEALQRAEDEWIDDPAPLSDEELENSHGILLSIIANLPAAEQQLEQAERRLAEALRSRGYSPERPKPRRYR